MTQNALNRSGLPNKAEILAFVKASGEVNRHKIARSFNVKKSNRAALRAMIKELRREGIFDFLAPERVGNDHSRELPKVAVARLLRNDKGRWQAKLVDKQFEELVVIPLAPDLQRQNLAKLFQGELILCRLTKNERAGPQIQQIIRFLSGEKGKANRKVSRQGDLGPDFAIIHKKKHGLFAELIDRRRNETIEIRDTAFGVGQLDQDDIVQLDPVKPGLVLRKLTRLNATDAPTQMSITRHQLPDQFSSQAQLEAKQLQIFGETEVATGKKRQDWTHLPFVTIDPADAKDHDDAVYAQPLPEKKVGASMSRSPTSHIMWSKGVKLTRKPISAAFRFISPIGSCRCCRQDCRMIYVRCGGMSYDQFWGSLSTLTKRVKNYLINFAAQKSSLRPH